MKLVKWEEFLPNSASVTFSSLMIPDEPCSLNRDVAQIRLPAGLVIDVEWCDEENLYVVTLYRHEYENILVQNTFKSASDVVQAVKSLAEEHYRGSALTTWSTESEFPDPPVEFSGLSDKKSVRIVQS